MHNQIFSDLISAIQKGAPCDNEVCRIFHGRGDKHSDINFINLDWYPPYLFLSCYHEVDEEFKKQLVDTVWREQGNILGALGLVFQYRAGKDTQVSIPFGDVPDQFTVSELGGQYRVKLTKTQNTGIFPDMRTGREFVKLHAKNAKVLNLFSYTCAFSVIAKLGGADSVLNMDMNKSVLRTGLDNHKLNKVEHQVKFLPHDILKSFGKLKKSGPFDLIIVDPPSFQKGSFVLTKDYRKILRRLPELCNNGSQLLLCANSPEVSESEFRAMIEEGTNGKLRFSHRLAAAPRFEEPKGANLKALVYSV